MKLSLIIPTYNERENILKLIPQINTAFNASGITGEIIVVDDNSPDGTAKAVEGMQQTHSNLRVVRREGKLGLSSAVLKGFALAEGEVCGVMDADLSHPANTITLMYKEILAGADLVIGSRYARGGEIRNWGIGRRVLSRGATLLARVFTPVKDPMSGFFMVRRECVENKNLNPLGFKILLEIILKADCRKMVEVPIVFVDRAHGQSKAGLHEIIYYLRNILGYLPYKKRVAVEFVRFAVVGGVGTLLNLFVLYVLTEKHRVYYLVSAIAAFIAAATSNFIFNKIWTFQERLMDQMLEKYLTFFLVSVSALGVNLAFLFILTEYVHLYYIFSQALAIGVALIINFLGNKIWTFNK